MDQPQPKAGTPAPTMHAVAERLGTIEAIDPVAERLSGLVGRATSDPRVKDLLSGTWLGHALHPLFTDVPIGAWTSAMVLDLHGDRRFHAAADRLIGFGVGAALPTIATGLSDWADTGGAPRRMGVVHAAANSAALGLYSASLAARRRGRRRLGVALALAGGGALTAGGFVGGHLAYSRGVGVDQTVFEAGLEDWTAALAEAELPEGRPVKAEVEGIDVMLLRRDGAVRAISDRCTHRGGPLHEGSIEDGCIECPWHGSRFSVEDGSVARGPATAPQPAYDVRVREGVVELRSRARS